MKSLPLLKVLILDLYANLTEDKDFAVFISSISHCSSLECLNINLSGNCLTEVSGAAIANSLSCLKDLKMLSLNFEENKIGSAGLISLGKVLP